MASKTAFVIALAASAVQTATAAPAKNNAMIIGGEPAKAGEIPYMVSIQSDGTSLCGGVLLNANTVLTAAVCAPEDFSLYQVRAGSLEAASGGTIANISSAIIHHKFDPVSLENDIALLKLATPIHPNSMINYATLLPAQGSDPVEGTVATTSGWGNTEFDASPSATLLKVSVPVVNRQTCQTAYEDLGGASFVKESMVCAGLKEGGKDSCMGDGGGPLIDNLTGTIIGLVSKGWGCALPDKYGVYTRVGSFIDFIKANL